MTAPRPTSVPQVSGIPSNRFWESVLTAFAAIRANKMRSLLTALGVLIGVMNVVAMVSVISGVNQSVLDVFKSMGTNSFTVTKLPASGVTWAEYLEYIRRPDFTDEDAEAIRRACPAVVAVSPQSIVYRRVKFESEVTENITVVGVTPDYQYVTDSAVGDGRFFAWTESNRRRQVVVLGAPIKEYLFPARDPIGRDLKIGGRRFTVVGVMEPMGEMFGQALDEYVIVPFGTLNKLYGDRLTTRLSCKAGSSEEIDDAIRQVERVLRVRRRLKPDEDNNFEIVTQSQLVEMYEGLTRITWIVMIGISAIALVVAGVGVMNIMFVSVTERTREIGIRKAVGARARDIATQFLVEAAVLSFLGGLFGLIVAAALGGVVALLTPIPAAVQLWSVVVALGVSLGVGIFFGLYPAAKASRLDPIVALRYE
mgnify:CR=1 FL=1